MIRSSTTDLPRRLVCLSVAMADICGPADCTWHCRGPSSASIIASIRDVYADDEDGVISDAPASPSDFAIHFGKSGNSSSTGLSIGAAVLELSDGTRELSVSARSRCFALDDVDPFAEY